MPFGSISLPGIGGWNSKPRSLHSARSTVDLSGVSDGFGVPSVDDPDPFGVRALEQAGLEIKEAGTQSRPTSETFEFKPSPTSPIFRQSFQSIDGVSRQGSVGRESVLHDPRRDSKRSVLSVDHGTQTAKLSSHPSSPRLEDPRALLQSPLRKSFEAQSSPRAESGPVSNSPLRSSFDTHSSALDDTKPICESPLRRSLDVQSIHLQEPQQDDKATSEEVANDQTTETTEEAHERGVESAEDEEGEDDYDESDDEPIAIIEEAEPVVQVIAHTITSPTATRAKVVNISRRQPPTIPLRSPLRSRMPKTTNMDEAMDHLSVDYTDDVGSLYSPSPTKEQFEQAREPSSKTGAEQSPLPDVEAVMNEDLTVSAEKDVPVKTIPDQAIIETEDVRYADLVAKEEVLQHVRPIGDMIRAGLDDNSDDEEYFDYADVPLPMSPLPIVETSNVDQDVHQAPASIDAFLPPRSALRNKFRPISPLSNQSVLEMQNLSEEATINDAQNSSSNPYHSPGLHSISSDEDRNSRVQSSAPTENPHDASSMSDYGDYDSRCPDTNYTKPQMPSNSLTTIPSETNISKKPTWTTLS